MLLSQTHPCYRRKKKTINQPLNFDGETLEGLNINGTSRIVHVFLGAFGKPDFGGRCIESLGVCLWTEHGHQKHQNKENT